MSLTLPMLHDRGRVNIVEKGRLHPAVSFSRASTGWYMGSNGLLVSASTNIPRFEYTGAGSYLGLLIEEQRTNLCLQSQAFNASPWVGSTGGSGTLPVITADYAIAPDGATTADRVQMNIAAGTTSTDISQIYSNSTTPTTVGAIYAASFWGKTNNGITATATVIGVGTTIGAATISPAYSRFSLPAPATSSSTALPIRIRLRGNESTSKSADLSLWQAQVELGSAATSSIPTTTSATTRSADVAQATSLSMLGINTTAGTFVIEHDAPTGAPLLYSGSNPILVSQGGTKVAIAYDASGTTISVNGGTPTTGTALTWGTTLSILQSASAWANAHCKSLSWYNTKRTGDVQRLST